MSADAGVDDLFEKELKEQARANKKAAEHQKKMEASSKIISDRQEKHLQMENKLMTQRRMLEVGTRMGGGMTGSVMGFMSQIASMKVLDYSSQKDSLKTKQGNFPLTGVDRLNKDKQESTMLGRLDKTIDRAFGGDSKWNKMFGGHGRMAAMGAGGAAAGGGLALTKAIIDSSAMLQQMLKLLQFGVMLVLKPIGDFFGFLMRPIMILLLRKFIIPFYQKVYPWFVTQGAKLGDGIVKIFNLLDSPVFYMALAGAFGTAMAAIWKGTKIFTNTMMDSLASKIGIQVAAAQKGGAGVVDDVITSAADKTTKKTPAWINKDGSFNKDWQQEQAKLKNAKTSSSTTKSTTVEDDFKAGKSNLNFDKEQKGNVFNQLRDEFAKVQERISKRKWTPPSVKQIATLGKAMFRGLPQGMVMEGMGVTDALLDSAFDLVEGFAGLAGVKIDLPTMSRDTTWDNAMANGGIINEPISGIGQRSGQSYLFGEAGSEMVVPMSKAGGMGGTTVNITIGNMSGNANDLNKLRSTILEVMQTVNVNRGR